MAKKEGEDTKALLQEQAEFEARRRGEMAKKASDDAKKASDEAKKRAEDAQKKAEEAERKKQEFKKQQDALLLKYTDEIQKLTVEKMEDGFEKEKKAIEADAKSKIEQLKQDGAKRGEMNTARAQFMRIYTAEEGREKGRREVKEALSALPHRQAAGIVNRLSAKMKMLGENK